MNTTQLFETWWRDNWKFHADEKEAAQAAWDAALKSAEEHPDNNRKRIGVEILERALREAEFMEREAQDDALPRNLFIAKSIEKLIQELKS